MRQQLALAVVLGYCGVSVGLATPPNKSAFQPKSMACVLQADKLAKSRAEAVQKLAASGRDLVVVDSCYSGHDRWTTSEIAEIRAGRAGRKVLAYFSIGEAENYREYWHKQWDADKDGHPDAAAPKFLGDVNPDWPGNYRVNYWQAPWQQLLLKELDGILKQGFDGVYLDIVDAFEPFEMVGDELVDNFPNSETGHTYREDMVNLVGKIAAHARAAKPGYLIVPQNGAQLVEIPEYLTAIDAQGVEDLFTVGDEVQSAEDVKDALAYLTKVQAAGKSVLVVDYGTTEKTRQRSIDGAKKHGLTLLLSDRQLTTLGTSPGR